MTATVFNTNTEAFDTTVFNTNATASDTSTVVLNTHTIVFDSNTGAKYYVFVLNAIVFVLHAIDPGSRPARVGGVRGWRGMLKTPRPENDCGANTLVSDHHVPGPGNDRGTNTIVFNMNTEVFETNIRVFK